MLQIFGQNKLEEKEENKILKFLGLMWNPLLWVMEAAAVMAIALANGGEKPPDWQDFVGIVTLLVINSTVSFIEENNVRIVWLRNNPFGIYEIEYGAHLVMSLEGSLACNKFSVDFDSFVVSFVLVFCVVEF